MISPIRTINKKINIMAKRILKEGRILTIRNSFDLKNKFYSYLNIDNARLLIGVDFASFSYLSSL